MKEKPIIPSENRKALALVDALASMLVARRRSRDYGSLSGEDDVRDVVYEMPQSAGQSDEGAGHSFRSDRRKGTFR